MRSGHPGNFQDFDRHKDWKRKLVEERVDTELLAAQVDFNRSEGGIEDFLNFRSESQFVRKFLSMTMPDSEAGAVREVVAEHVGRLSNLPQLERRRDAMRRLQGRFAPFVEIADEAQSAHAHVVRRIRHAVSLRAALAEHGKDASHRAGKLSEEASGHEAAAEVAAAKCRKARVLNASATVEMARRGHEAAKALAETRERELDEAQRRKRLLAGAVARRDINDDRARSDNLRRAIDAQHADLQPLRDELCAVGADLQATLGHRAMDLRERQRAQSTGAETRRSAAQEAGVALAAADKSARAERLAAGRIERDIEHAESFRADLEQEQILEPDESAEAASQRHAQAARTAEAEVRELRRQADAKDREAKEHLQTQAELKAERSGLEAEIGSARENVREGEAKRRALAFHSTILKLTGESEVDPDADGVARVLAQARSGSIVVLRDAERRQEVLDADRESLEATGLASIDKDVRAVAERLRDSGIRDAQPYAVYLSEILRSPEEIRQFSESDPARFVGVAVPGRDALERAREALKSLPILSRPVVVAVAADVTGDAPDDRFVLPVDEAAAYDREAARELQRRIEDSLEEIAESIRAEQNRVEHLESTHRDLEAWRERFGGGRLEEAWRGIERREARVLEIEREIEDLSERVAADERDARACRDGASEHERQANACSARARRAREHHETWESKVEGWRLARLRHEHAAQAAEQRAREKEAERERLEREARDHAEQARKAAAEAASIESKIGNIAYTGPGGRVRDNLDALRRDYEQRLETLAGLESERVEGLRWRKEEIDRRLAKGDGRFARAFGDLDPVEVETEAAREGLQEAADVAEADLETARTNASDARSDAKSAGREYASEKERRAKEVRPEPLVDLHAVDSEEIAGIAPRAERTIVEQEGIEARETSAARRARREAERDERLAKDCKNWVDTLGGILDDDSTPPEGMDLPREEEIPERVSAAASSLKQAQDAFSEARSGVYESYEDIRKFTSSDAFKRIESEREVAAHLRENDALAAATNAHRTAGLIEDRLKTIEHDLSRLDDDLQACVAELERLLGTALHIVRRMVRDGRIPEHVPRFGGEPVFRMSADLSRVAVAQRKDILRSYITDLAEADRVPETGQDIATELMDRMAATLGRETLGIRLLKPKGEGDTEHMPIDKVTVSGGELLTAAMMIYLVLARLRAKSMHRGAGEAGILIMDNPLGKANKALLLKTQIGLADAMGIQLLYTTGVQELQIFGDEKRLDQLRKGGSTLFEGRISLDDLECYPVAPPLPYETPERCVPGQPILVLENYHSFDSFRRWNQEAALYAAVAYGGGNAFRQGAGNLDELIARTGAGGAIYLGDLDPAGVRILIGVNARRQVEGQAPLRPHRGLYRWLLANGHRRPLEATPGDDPAHRLGEIFPADVVNAFVDLWSGRERVPQESFGLEQLGGTEAEIAAPDTA